MTVPSEHVDTVAVHVVADSTRPPEYEIEGYGFTISHTAADTNPTQPLLPQDPMRTRALICSNSATSFLGTPEQMSSVTAQMTGTDPGPGVRIPSGAVWTEVQSQGEMWIGFTGVCQIGVWVERRIPRGMS